ncbi:hypothetical protein [Salipiger sp. PrR003]|uniref:hypothetical protein n=1 Tax=Salipiger sp. PrR003 TaxID=2706776 RepID=UPI0013D919D4|nr:hypothetical protein [Salipiger sp. PrR003]NDV50560.1 hypothetical protein [Salipiger sp. PrR003]
MTPPSFADTYENFVQSDAFATWASDPCVARSLLSKLHGMALYAGDYLTLNVFEGYSEEDLDQWAQSIGRALGREGGDPWSGASSDEEKFRNIIAALRYIDEYLRSQPQLLSDDDLEEFTCSDGAYVVPCRNPKDFFKIGRSFRRRGMKYHRIIPGEIELLKIRLHISDDFCDLTADRGDRRLVGAAIFPKVQLECTDTVTTDGKLRFIADDISSPDQDYGHIIDSHHSEAVKHKCDTLIWPELTMPPSQVTRLKRALAGDPLIGERPPVVVTGTWHEQVDGKFRNRGHVLDGRGREQLHFDKVLAYMQRDNGRSEDIASAQDVPLLWCDGELIAFFTCLDFCHVERIKFLTQCDFSLALVPSMGGLSTVASHKAQAAHLASLRKTPVVVVQQISFDETQPDAPGNGYIVLDPPQALSAFIDGARVESQFTTFYIPASPAMEP